LFINHDIIPYLIFCYLIGSIPFGLLVSVTFKKNDPRLVGSKNIGATNITRISGWKLGLMTLILDVLKGYIPIILLKQNQSFVDLMILFLFLGHLFPFWIKFKGGKGIAVIIGCLTAYNFFCGLIFVCTWLFVAVVSKYSSLSALVSSFLVLIFISFKQEQLFWVMLLIVLMIFAKHLTNIKRLLRGEESKIVLKNKN
jgi:acyl phosphate:glycerol-3-phosphate acyltransferase